AVARDHTAPGVEPRRQADDELLRSVAGSARRTELRQRLQDPVGGVHSARGGRRTVPLDVARGRQGRAAGGVRAAELEGAALGGRAGVGSVTAREPFMNAIRLPTAQRTLEVFRLSAPRDFPPRTTRPFNRIAYSAAHVVADPRAAVNPWLDCAIDWDATIAY